MNKIVIAFLILCVSAAGFAVDGEGTIQEIRVCDIATLNHKNFMLYRLSDGNWFAAYGQFIESGNSHGNRAYAGDTVAQSVVLMAFANNLPIKVRATYSTVSRCGVIAHHQWNKEGDYIILKRD